MHCTALGHCTCGRVDLQHRRQSTVIGFCELRVLIKARQVNHEARVLKRKLMQERMCTSRHCMYVCDLYISAVSAWTNSRLPGTLTKPVASNVSMCDWNPHDQISLLHRSSLLHRLRPAQIDSAEQADCSPITNLCRRVLSAFHSWNRIEYTKSDPMGASQFSALGQSPESETRPH
jgi:hypothetical protein